MIARKIYSTIIAGLIVFLFHINASAEFFSVSVGIPLVHSTADSSLKTDSVSGAMVHVKFPIMVGVGYESYVTEFEDISSSSMTDLKLTTSMFDIFYLLPIPVVNVTIGLGGGVVSLECTINTEKCDDKWDDGLAGQFYGQLGFSPFPFLDVHLGYHVVRATLKAKEDDYDNVDASGNVVSFGVSFIF